MNVASEVVATDGDEETVDLLTRNIDSTETTNIVAAKLYWSESESSVFLERYGMFDIILAADVIYEHEQVVPLITTVRKLLKSDFILNHIC
jgi:predicted nicotinamide N-methyase